MTGDEFGPRGAADALLAAIVESSDDAIIGKSLDGIVTSWNPAAERLFGYSRGEMLGLPVSILAPPDRKAEMPTILERIRRGERVHHYDTVRRHKNGDLIDVSLTVSPILGRSGAIIGASKIARDIRERKRAEAQQRLLLDELNHRVKNTLALVQSIAKQTLKSVRSPEEFGEAFFGRVMALSDAHNLLTESAWVGVDLHDIVRVEMHPYLGDAARRLIVDGDPVQCSPRMALTLVLVVHELAANAAKHGALSVPEGRVVVRWRVEASSRPPQLRLEWLEAGGPTVARPSRKGFGSHLIERSLAFELGGSAQLDFAPGGVRCLMRVPLGGAADRVPQTQPSSSAES